MKTSGVVLLKTIPIVIILLKCLSDARSDPAAPLVCVDCVDCLLSWQQRLLSLVKMKDDKQEADLY